MKITSIHTHYIRIPFDMGAPKQEFAGLRFPTMDHLLVQVETELNPISKRSRNFGRVKQS